MAYEIIEKLKRELGAFTDDAAFESVGTVVETGDGIAKISGLSKALSQELLTIDTSAGEVSAVAFNLEEQFIGAVILAEAGRIRIGDRVRQTGRVISIPVGDALLGRVIDPLGNPLDEKGALLNKESVKQYPLERSAPGVIARQSVNAPLHTGIMAIDAMIPIGRGQRELIIGDRQTGKTAIALDAILNQKNDANVAVGRPSVMCVYVAIGQKNSKIAQLVKILKESGALEYTVVVSAPASAPASLQYLAPFAGCAVGEYFMDNGRDALVVYDDLTKHANAYRELSLLLRRPPGREAFPGDIFYLHARLLERAAKLNKENGGGSLTALPIIETQLGDVSAYIPTNVISITDGQIYLESNLFHQGQRPAVNAGLSVSRVGSAAQTKAMKKVAGKLRLELAQFRELQAFAQFSSDLDENTKRQIERGRRLTELLKQIDGEPLPFEEQVAVMYVAINGLIDDIAVVQTQEFAAQFRNYLRKLCKHSVLEPLRTEGQLTDKTEAALKQAVEEFKNIK